MTSGRATTTKEIVAPSTCPPAPEGQVIYVIGDIHGSLNLLERVFDAIDADKASPFRGSPPHQEPPLSASASAAPVTVEIYLGDYIDRGEDSRGVVDALIKRSKHVDTVFLRGNHEQFLLDFLVERLDLSMWKHVGAIATLKSYGVQMRQRRFFTSESSLRSAFEAALPKAHARFFTNTIPYFVAGPYLFVHAGIRPGFPLKKQHLADLMAIRRSFLDFTGDFGHIVVHGHTPVEVPEFKPNRINLDTAAYSTGRLTCLKIGPRGPELLET